MTRARKKRALPGFRWRGLDRIKARPRSSALAGRLLGLGRGGVQDGRPGRRQASHSSLDLARDALSHAEGRSAGTRGIPASAKASARLAGALRAKAACSTNRGSPSPSRRPRQMGAQLLPVPGGVRTQILPVPSVRSPTPWWTFGGPPGLDRPSEPADPIRSAPRLMPMTAALAARKDRSRAGPVEALLTDLGCPAR